jgi:hypothetical protein
MALHNVLGRKVVTLVSGVQPPGNHAVLLDMRSLARGPYVLTLRAGNYLANRRVVW